MKQYVMWWTCSLRRIFLLYVTSVILCAALFSIIEGKTFADSLWWSCVTSLTIGYGDMYPVTATGRIVAMVFAHFWIFGIAPLIVANILSTMIKDENEWTHQEQEDMMAILKGIEQRLTK